MNKKDNDYLLGCFAHYMTPQRAYYGGILITDVQGVPKEFRHSEAVRPSRLQATLYGESLEECLGTDALAPALYESIRLKPDILLIDKEGRELFGPYVNANAPAVLLVPLADRDLAFADVLSKDSDLLDAYDYDLKGSTTERIYAYINDIGNTVTQILAIAQKRMNIISPFGRIRTALAEISLVDSGRTDK